VPQTLQYLSKAQTTPRKRSACLCLIKSVDKQAKSIGIKHKNEGIKLVKNLHQGVQMLYLYFIKQQKTQSHENNKRND
jgi:hypothetical protein